MNDKHLLALVKSASQNADRDAFVEICNLKAREVIFLCIRHMGNLPDGEDAAQEVFIRMQKSITRLQAPEAFNVWLNRLVHTTCVNMKRDSMKHRNALPIESLDDSLLEDSQIDLPQEYAEDTDKRRRLASLIDDLPDKYRVCILMHYYQHLSYAEIAEACGISQDAVNNNMRMARKMLKLELDNEKEREPKLWSMASMVALGPVLATSLQEAAASAVTPGIMAGCLTAAGIPAALAVGTAGAALAGGSSAVTAATGAVAAKLIAQIGIAAALVLGGGGATFMAVQNAKTETPPAYSQTAPLPPGDNAILPPPAAQEGTPSLYGQVFLASGGPSYGLAGITLQLLDAENPMRVAGKTVTESDGRFSFYSIPAGNYQLLITLPPNAEGVPEGDIRLLPDELNPKDAVVLIQGEATLALTENVPLAGLEIALNIPSRLQGQVVLQENGHPISYNAALMAGAEMQLYDPQGQLVATTTLAEDGQYLFENPPICQTGRYSIHILTDSSSGAEISTEVTTVELYPGFSS